MFGIVSRSTKEYAVCGKFNRSELDVGFLEKMVRAERHLEHTGQFQSGVCRDNGSGKGKYIGVQFQPLA